MSLIPVARGRLSELADSLDAGEPVVVPLASPLPYVVIGTRAAAVNEAKGRPGSQPVGVSVSSLDPVLPAVDLDAAWVDLARWLVFDELASVLLPVNANVPAWLEPAVSDGVAFVGGVLPPALNPLMSGRTHVYMSSANITGTTPAVTAAQAQSMFGDRLLIADGDGFRDQSLPHGSSTMISVSSDGSLGLARPGINNRAFGDDHDAYLADLCKRWRARS
jgi:tRNA A37 threonylcarbamoyladenosine synthetase subunit TsaC/SUA5/YrdC